MSQLVSDTNGEISDEETRRETDGSTNPQGRVEREQERIPLTDKVKVSQLLSYVSTHGCRTPAASYDNINYHVSEMQRVNAVQSYIAG